MSADWLQATGDGDGDTSMFSPFWGNSPETVVAQTLAEEFGIDPSQVTVAYEGSIHGLPDAGPEA
jgi:CO/xanthine dehydrogenase Mo-binding subunit